MNTFFKRVAVVATFAGALGAIALTSGEASADCQGRRVGVASGATSECRDIQGNSGRSISFVGGFVPRLIASQGVGSKRAWAVGFDRNGGEACLVRSDSTGGLVAQDFCPGAISHRVMVQDCAPGRICVN